MQNKTLKQYTNKKEQRKEKESFITVFKVPYNYADLTLLGCNVTLEAESTFRDPNPKTQRKQVCFIRVTVKYTVL